MAVIQKRLWKLLTRNIFSKANDDRLNENGHENSIKLNIRKNVTIYLKSEVP